MLTYLYPVFIHLQFELITSLKVEYFSAQPIYTMFKCNVKYKMVTQSE